MGTVNTPRFPFLDGKIIFITGGTGSFGKRLIQDLFEYANPQLVIVYSRDELKQFMMQEDKRFSPRERPIRYFLGDVRDAERLQECTARCDVIVHAAALKQVPATEYNPFEAIQTNVMGAKNVIRAALANNVERVIALSTDKACNPINLYGATKLCSDKLFVNANALSHDSNTIFSVVRYGNVVASRGSVFPVFRRQAATGKITITHRDMTRFSITLQEGVLFVLRCLENMVGGELFVPKIPSYRINDVATALAPDCEVVEIGIRGGEKLNEVMVPVDECHNVLELPDFFIIQPSFEWWFQRGGDRKLKEMGGKPVAQGFSYDSGTNPHFLTVFDELDKQIDWSQVEQIREIGEKQMEH